MVTTQPPFSGNGIEEDLQDISQANGRRDSEFYDHNADPMKYETSSTTKNTLRL